MVSSPSAASRRDSESREMINMTMVRGTATLAGLVMICLVSTFGDSRPRRTPRYREIRYHFQRLSEQQRLGAEACQQRPGVYRIYLQVGSAAAREQL